MLSRITGITGGIGHDKDKMAQQRQTYLMSVISDFKRYPSLKSELTTEVSANLLANLRPAEESNYLARLVDVLALIDRTYQQAEGQSWEDDILIHINPTFAGTPTESEVAAQTSEESLFVELIETVRDCCHELNTECVAIAEIMQRFPYVRQNPARFPTISSLTETNEPTPIPATEQTERAMNEPESAPTSTGQQSQSTEPDETQTITWNLNASVLYDIFGQLLTMKLPNGVTPISREGHTIKHLAAMIHRNIYFTKGNSPTLDQIERQLQRMTEPGGTGAKRDKITIDCRSESDF